MLQMDRTLYYQALVGALAGLSGWFVTSLLQWWLLIVTDFKAPGWMESVVLTTTVTLMATLAVTMFERYSFGARQVFSELFATIFVSLILGAGLGIVHHVVGTRLMGGAPALWQQVILNTLMISAIGLVIAMDVFKPDFRRFLLGGVGGVFGGLLGAFFILLLSLVLASDSLIKAPGYSLMLLCVCLGAALAPVLSASAWIRYVDTDDHKTKKKYAGTNKKWTLGGVGMTIGTFRKLSRSDIYLPDNESIAEKHAVITPAERGYSLSRHPDNLDSVLEVNGRPVNRPVLLKDRDEIVVGTTVLEFRLQVDRG